MYLKVKTLGRSKLQASCSVLFNGEVIQLLMTFICVFMCIRHATLGYLLVMSGSNRFCIFFLLTMCGFFSVRGEARSVNWNKKYKMGKNYFEKKIQARSPVNSAVTATGTGHASISQLARPITVHRAKDSAAMVDSWVEMYTAKLCSDYFRFCTGTGQTARRENVQRNTFTPRTNTTNTRHE